MISEATAASRSGGCLIDDDRAVDVVGAPDHDTVRLKFDGSFGTCGFRDDRPRIRIMTPNSSMDGPVEPW